MQRIFKPESKDRFIRIACAYAWYHYPEDVNFKNNLLMLLEDPTSLSWLQKCKLMQHLPNQYRAKLLKYYPQLFPEIDLFILMISAFIPEDDITELALAQVPHLRTQVEYQKILSLIPEKDIEGFKYQAEQILDPILNPERTDLSFCQIVPHENASHPDKDTSILNPVTPNAALLTVSAVLCYYTQNYHFSVPILWGLYSLYNFINNGLHATATKIERFLPFSSLFATTPKIDDNKAHSHALPRPPNPGI